MDVCTFSVAPGRLRFHEIAHRDGTCFKRTNEAQSQGTIVDSLYVPAFTLTTQTFLVSPPPSSRCGSPPT